MDSKETTGAFEAPPAGAPHEVSSANVAPTADQIDAASRNERTLAPLVFQPAPVPVEAPRVAKPAVAPRPPSNPMPAASDSDSPSRGIPRAIDDPGKIITGGFGLAGPAQYFPLDGGELKEAVRGLMDQLNARIENDLRFHMAITYPRVTAIVSVQVKGWTGDTDFTIEKQFVHDRTPEAVALELGAQPVDFTVEESIREFDAEGVAQDPPDRVRDQLGLPKPRKQHIQTPGGRMIVDRPNNLLDSF